VHCCDAVESVALIRDADVAMYAAKAAGRGRYRVYHSGMADELDDIVGLDHDLRLALARGDLELHYQPQVRTADRSITGVEALLRWRSPARGDVPPDRFVAVAERSDLILELGEFVLTEACRQAAPPGDPARAELAELRAAGVRVAIDDFGTGYSSMAQLQHLPVDVIKIDRSFVCEIGHSRTSAAIVDNIVRLAGALELDVIAEGIETDHQLELLRAVGCFYAQGFLFARPAPAAHVGEALRGRTGGGERAA